mgnify:CR=1 FL=1
MVNIGRGCRKGPKQLMEKIEPEQNAGFLDSLACTITAHALIPAVLVVWALAVVPPFEAKAREFLSKPDALTRLVFGASAIVRSYWYLCLIVLALALAGDAWVCSKLRRRSSKAAARLWSGAVIGTEALLAGACAIALMGLLNTLANTAGLCPV